MSNAGRALSYEDFSEMFGDVPDVAQLTAFSHDNGISEAADRRVFAQNPPGANRYIIDLCMRLGVLGAPDINIILLSRIAVDRADERHQRNRERPAYD